MMKKFILIAALGLFSLNITAQDAPKEEGFVFTTEIGRASCRERV